MPKKSRESEPEEVDPEDILDPDYEQPVDPNGAEGMPCPACGKPLTRDGNCTNPACDA